MYSCVELCIINSTHVHTEMGEQGVTGSSPKAVCFKKDLLCLVALCAWLMLFLCDDLDIS